MLGVGINLDASVVMGAFVWSKCCPALRFYAWVSLKFSKARARHRPDTYLWNRCEGIHILNSIPASSALWGSYP